MKMNRNLSDAEVIELARVIFFEHPTVNDLISRFEISVSSLYRYRDSDLFRETIDKLRQAEIEKASNREV